MLIKEMHILFDNLLQEINSNRKGQVLPSEKDLRINVATLNWIKTRISKKSNRKGEGFEESQSRYDNVKELKKQLIVSTFEDISTLGTIKRVKALLPPNYMHLISSQSYLKYNCNGLTFGTLNSGASTGRKVVYFTPSGVTPYASIADTTPAVGHTHFDDMKINFNAAAGVDNTSFAFLTTNSFKNILGTFKSNDPKFTLVMLIQEQLNQVIDTLTNGYKVEVYWEKYYNIFRPNCLIFVEKLIPTGAGGVSMTTIEVFSKQAGGTISVVHNPTSIYLPYYRPTGEVIEDVYPNRLLSTEDIPLELKDPFGKTIYFSPISELSDNELRVYYDNTFYPSQLVIDYLAIPRLVNYYMNWSSPINPAFHEELVKLAVKSIKADINDQTYQQALNEVITME